MENRQAVLKDDLMQFLNRVVATKKHSRVFDIVRIEGLVGLRSRDRVQRLDRPAFIVSHRSHEIAGKLPLAEGGLDFPAARPMLSRRCRANFRWLHGKGPGPNGS